MAEHPSPDTASDDHNLNENADAGDGITEAHANGNGATNGAANGNGAAPLVPRVLPPEGARSARTFEGAPVETLPDYHAANEAEVSAAIAPTDELLDGDEDDFSSDGADYRADLQDSFVPMSGAISIEKVATDDDELSSIDAQISEAGSDAIGSDVLTGEQLFDDDGTTDFSSNLAMSGGDNGGDEPPSNLVLDGGAAGRPDTPRDKEAGLFDHLIELRQRLLYAIFGVMAMMCLTWRYSLELQDWFSAPILRVLNNNGIKKGILMVTGPTDTFTIYFQFALVSALILAMPWVLFQVWRFIEPALTNSERRYTLVLVPFSSVLFFMGVALGYALSPLFFQFFLQFQPQNVAAQWNYQDSIMLMAKMLMIFGLSFQVPIVIIFGNKIGLLSRNLLIEYWRHAVVVIFIVVAILTPTWDPFTMTACAVPPCLLYLLSIWLVKWL